MLCAAQFNRNFVWLQKLLAEGEYIHIRFTLFICLRLLLRCGLFWLLMLILHIVWHFLQIWTSRQDAFPGGRARRVLLPIGGCRSNRRVGSELLFYIFVLLEGFARCEVGWCSVGSRVLRWRKEADALRERGWCSAGRRARGCYEGRRVVLRWKVGCALRVGGSFTATSTLNFTAPWGFPNLAEYWT